MIGDYWVCGYSPKHGYYRNKSKEPFKTEKDALDELKLRRLAEDERSFWRGCRTVVLIEILHDGRGTFKKLWECTLKNEKSPIRKKNEIGNFTYGY